MTHSPVPHAPHWRFLADGDGPDEVVRQRWLELWRRSPQRSPFAHPAYAEAVRHALEVSYDVHALDEDGGQALAVVPHRRRGPYRTVRIPPLTPYTSFLFAPAPDPARVHARASGMDGLLAALAPHYHALQFHLHPSLADVRPASWAGYAVQPFYTYRAPLGTQDDVLGTWSAAARRLYRKAGGDFEVREAAAAIPVAVRLCAERYRQQGRAFPAPAEAVHRIAEALHAAGLLRPFVASRTSTGEAEAGLLALVDDRCAYYWIAGSQPGPAMTVLLAEALPHLFANGQREIDYVGANTPSIAEFKRRLGGVLTPYYRIERVRRPELGLLRRFMR